ncbi:MAG: hypothetical protein NT011_11965 [Kiritimatiellaeota bacterium]|nr:hypothetical protein [Kiritimatiellota bacterium]
MKTQYLQRMLIGLGLTMALAVPWASATNYYVVTSSQQPSPTPPWTNWGWAHTNLIEVVAVARDNDTVYVTNNATYWLTNQITVSYAITVRSWGPGGILDPTNTILDGNYPNTTNRHFTLNKYGATVAGFTLTKGCDNWARGGSILLQNGIVTNCTIVSNYAFAAYPYGGGGVHMQDSSGGVWNCTISGNTSSNAGGGIGINSGGPWRIANCLISGNSAGVQGCGIWSSSPTAGTVISNCWVVSNYVGGNGGAGIYLKGECHNSFIMGNTCNPAVWGEGGGVRAQNGSLVRNCLIANNICYAGGGIATYDTMSIQNCTIVSNYASSGYGGLFISRTNAAAKVENTIIWGNRTDTGTSSNWGISAWGDYAMSTFTNCCTSPNIVYTFATEVNTITNDPRFVNNATDFRLQSSSPCINAGVNRAWMENALDVYGNRRIDNFRRTVDIGAYEYLSKGTVFGFQ